MDRDAGQGDNLFLSSIVAVHADDGTYAWHYQETPWETWDYDTGQQLMLLDMEVDGQMRHVVTQASKNGFFYVLDAATGEFLSGENYTEVNWATGINKETGRPFIVPEARYNVTNAVFNLVPGPAGGHAWQPMSYSPQTGLVYIPATTHWTLVGDFDARAQHLEENPNARQSFTGRLVAWDPVNQREVWRGEEQINPRGGVQVIGGALATAGNIVFNGSLPNQEFVAYRATDGERLWSFDAKTAVFPGAISYLVDGEQYVAIAVGGPVWVVIMRPTVLACSYSKSAVRTVFPTCRHSPSVPSHRLNSLPRRDVISAGGRAFEANCATCHAHGVGRGRSSFPDLRRTPALHSQELFDNIVLGGQLSANGMASFSEYIDAGDTEAIRAYIVSLAKEALEE